MLRVRFHGRGGHGIKTASRILGTAAFRAGLQAQDSPIYGAERRGAALTAFTRIAEQPICERGAVLDPDLIVVADETLLADRVAGVSAGIEFASALFINSPHTGESLAAQYHLPCPVVTADLTTSTLHLLGRGSALSAPLGAAACVLAGIQPLELILGAVEAELADLHLAPELITRNLELARQATAGLAAVRFRQRPTTTPETSLHLPTALPGPEGAPVIHAPGNSVERHTGAWRVFRPVIDLAACTRCSICFALCPDGAITLDGQCYPVIDYDNCKGCLICQHECPIHCITEQREVLAW